MTTCARPGCRRLLPRKRTRPSAYCSPACKMKAFRARRSALKERAVQKLVADARAVVDAWQAPIGKGYNFTPALEQLCRNPLVSGQQAQRPEVSSSQPRRGPRIGNDKAAPGQGGEG